MIASDSHTVVQNRHLPAWRDLDEFRVAGGKVEGDDLVRERHAGCRHGDPGPEGPGGIVLVADIEDEVRHGVPALLR
jgi:hypothetical protein